MYVLIMPYSRVGPFCIFLPFKFFLHICSGFFLSCVYMYALTKQTQANSWVFPFVLFFLSGSF